MLNKEMLLSSDVNKPHVLINFEYKALSFDQYYNGYIGKDDPLADFPLGSINRIPYWNNSGQRLILQSLYYYRSGSSRYTKSVLRETPEFSLWLTITIRGISHKFIHTSFSETVESDVYDFDGRRSETLGVTFNPPPDGYLDPNTLQPI